MERKQFKMWKEMNSERSTFGVKVWWTGGEIFIGKLHYRVRWAYPK